jgi:hypothetical protein
MNWPIGWSVCSTMSLTTKSPRKVTLVALAVGKEALPDYSHPCSPKVFTQPQLFACLVLKTFLRLGYRQIEAHLRDLPAYGQWLGLKRVPDHSTLQKAAARLFPSCLSEKMLDASIRLMMAGRFRSRRVARAALDSSGFEARHVSSYFVRRRQRGQKQAKNPLFQTTTYQRFPKLAVLCDCRSHLILAAVTGRGPSPDHGDLAKVLPRVPDHVTLERLLADAGYDSEANHRLAREEHGIASYIPAAIGRPTSKPPSGRYRRLMRRVLKRSGYGQRWQVETVFSMIKRNLTCELTARKYWTQCREMMTLVITHNIMILLLIRRFSTEHSRPPFSPYFRPRILPFRQGPGQGRMM